MKKEFKPLRWKVKNFDYNKQVIEDYDILKYREDFIKKLKKKCATKEEFSEQLQKEFQYHYWSRSEYELIIEIDSNNQVWLIPWCGCLEPEKVKINVTNDEEFDWFEFAKYHINKQIFKNEAKIDVYDQLMWNWTELINCLWVIKNES